MTKIPERTIIGTQIIQMLLLEKLSMQYGNQQFNVDIEKELNEILTQLQMVNESFEVKKRLLFNTTSVLASLLYFAIWPSQEQKDFTGITLDEFGISNPKRQSFGNFIRRFRNSLAHNRITLYDDETIHIEDGKVSKNGKYKKDYEITFTHDQLLMMTRRLINYSLMTTK